MTGPYDAKPWLARYGDVPAEVPPSVATALDLVHQAVRAAPEQRAITYFDGGLRYREVDDYSDAIAAYLAGRGFGRGDRLALYLQNVPQFVLTLVAAWKLGGVVVPVNPMYRERELDLVLRDAGVSALVCSEAAWDTVAAAWATAAATVSQAASEQTSALTPASRSTRSNSRSRYIGLTGTTTPPSFQAATRVRTNCGTFCR